MKHYQKYTCACDHPQDGAGSFGPIADKTEPPSLHPDQTTAAAVMAFQSLTADI